MPMPTDTTLTIRCPYCMAGIEFRPMIAHKDGRFVCRDCAPLLEAVPENAFDRPQESSPDPVIPARDLDHGGSTTT
jgi:hypothetical protein